MNWILLVLGIIFAVPPMWTWLKIKNHEKTKMQPKTFFIHSGLSLLFIVLFVVFTMNGSSNNSNNNSASNNSEQTSKPSSSSSISDDQFTNSEISKINKQLTKDLADDQKDADNGNQNYSWSNYVLKIEINKNKQARVIVDGNFVDLSEDAKNEVGKRTNGLIGRSIATAGTKYTPEDGRKGTYMSFYNGKQAIGHSRFTSNTKFKWYN